MRRPLSVGLAAAGLAVVVVASGVSYAAGPGWEPVQPLPVTGATVSYSQASIATAPGGAAIVTWDELVGGAGQVWAATRTATGDWLAQLLSPYVGNTPQAAMAPDGTATVIWSGSDGTNGGQILSRTHTTAGGWFPTTEVTGDGNPAMRPVISAAPSGALVAAWLWFNGTDIAVQAAHRTGEVWSTPQTLTRPGHPNAPDSVPAIATDAHGTTTVAWEETIDGHSVVRAARAAAGEDFDTPASLSDTTADASDVQVAATDGGATTAWRGRSSDDTLRYLAASYRHGRWQHPQVLDTFGRAVLILGTFGISLAGSDNVVHAIWTRRDAATGQWQLIHSELADRWSRPQVLPAGPGDASVPTMAALPDGEAVAAWAQTTPTTATVLFSRAGVGGGWSTPVTLGDTERNSFAPAVGVAAERALAAWTSGTSIATRATLRAGPVVPEPALSRPVRVGTPVTCRSAVVGAASLHYQWRRGQRIVGHHAAYVPKARDLRHRLRCTVTATNTLASLIRPSAAHRVGRGRFALLQDPQVTGTPRVGRVLRVTAGRWSPRPGDLTYLWRRGHTVLSRTRHYTPVGADHGRRLSVTVTATRHAYHHAVTAIRTPRIH